ncbi:MAG: ubiquinol-cytochrome C chaperone family protein [Hyphomicrobiaceae bacterium]
MLGWLKGGSPRRHTGQQLYERIVAQARDPALYETCGVPDTMGGRLEMILLHTVLTLDRLQSQGPTAQRLGQHLMEHLVADIDDALRRIGLGDDSVAPRIKRLASALAERTLDYRAALAQDTHLDTSMALEAAFREHVYRAGAGTSANDGEGLEATRDEAHRLAAYTQRARAALAALPVDDLLSGRLTFPAVVDPRAAPLESRS